MLIVHAVWGEGRLFLWAEDTTLPTETTSRARSRPHPFAASAGVLAPALGDPAATADHGELTLRLPGTARGPLPSPESGLDIRARAPGSPPGASPPSRSTPQTPSPSSAP